MTDTVAQRVLQLLEEIRTVIEQGAGNNDSPPAPSSSEETTTLLQIDIEAAHNTMRLPEKTFKRVRATTQVDVTTSKKV